MSTRGWVAFAAMSTIWGVPYLFIKIAIDGGTPPADVAWARVTLAAIVLLALAARAGSLTTLRGRLRFVIAYGVAEITLPFPLIAYGERRLPSSLTAILIASVPLMIALIASRLDAGERPTRMRLTGLLVGFAGVVTLVGLDVSSRPGELLGALAVLGAAVGYAIGPFLLKRGLIDLDPRATMGASLALASLLLAPLALLTAPSSLPSTGAFASLLVLGLLCTALAFVIFNTLIAEAGPGRASVITYINPVVAVFLGVTLLGERPGAGAVAGLLLILAGSWLSTDARLPPGLRRSARERARAPGSVNSRSSAMAQSPRVPPAADLPAA
jgi:drug/metabolite transporter (DMT)-like permease